MKSIHLFLCFLTLSSLLYRIESNSGFSTYLIHRNSPLSTQYNSSNTYYANLHISIQRARARSSAIFAPKLVSLQAPLTAGPTGDYNMKVSLGTPPQEFQLIVDTGSDLAWTQCLPCISCYKQDDPLFDPKKSSTYKKQSCNSVACKELHPTTSCDKKTDTCQYLLAYEDESESSGNLATESFTFQSTSGSPVVIPNIVFGCGHNNHGVFHAKTDGIVGLGDGKYSIVNELSEKYFSYCLVPLSANVASKINFGATGVVSGPGVKTTPIYKQGKDTYYYLNLQGVSVNGKIFKLNTKKYTEDGASRKGNIVIDSGTLLTFLQTDICSKIQLEFEKSISAKPIKDTPESFHLCYMKRELNSKEVPTVTFHFEGADIDLGDPNTMLEAEEGVTCLTIVPSSHPDSIIFGNFQQIDFLIGYDLVKKTVSFKKVDCSKSTTS